MQQTDTRSRDQFANDLTSYIHNSTTYLMLYTMTCPKKILYIVYAAKSVKLNPMVYMKFSSIQNKYQTLILRHCLK